MNKRERRTRAHAAQIERYVGGDSPLTELPAVGRSVQRVARPKLDGHQHDVLEICIIERGQVDWFAGDRVLQLTAGSVFFTPPGVVHGSVTGAMQPCTLAWLQVDPARLTDRSLAGDLKAISRLTWLDDGRLTTLHAALLVECRHRQRDTQRMARAVLHQLLGTVVRQAGPAPDARTLPEPVQRAMTLIERDPERRWTLDELQRQAGVGRSRLHELFKLHLGMGPGAYALRHRLRRAHDALRQSDASITTIATRLGFSSSQHLATAFRAHYGLTPRQCRRMPGL